MPAPQTMAADTVAAAAETLSKLAVSAPAPSKSPVSDPDAPAPDSTPAPDFTLPASNAPLADIDEWTVQLLDLVAQYEALVNGAYRSTYIDAFAMLSRANYYGGRRFGVDSFDMRPYRACATVDQMEIRREPVAEKRPQRKRDEKGHQDEGSEKEKKEKTSEGTEEKIPEGKDKSRKEKESGGKDESICDESADSTASGVRSSRRATLRNRKDSQKTPAACERRCKDPISQFGTLVPSQLRDAQGLFAAALATSAQVLRLQQQIGAAVEKVRGGGRA